MSASEVPRHPAPGRRWSTSEKRRIVELTLREGASVFEIALAHGIHTTSLSHWRSQYRAGKLTGKSSRKHVRGSAASAKLLPVTIAAEQEEHTRSARATVSSTVSMQMRESNTVYLSLPSGATIRFETGTLDVALIRALLAELRG
jgi:transposase-like protein